MLCPKCSVPLVVVERNDIELDWCPECEGFWFDESEIEILKYKLGINHKVINPMELDYVRTDENIYKCPRCNAPMGKVEVQGIILDKCIKNHGIWFDKSELSELFNKFSESEEGSGTVGFLGEVFKK
ncbi:zf-TFIIB domain-containing protein [bacterium]|nr:zf-TFIIB domain-containing protein [bacterium]